MGFFDKLLGDVFGAKGDSSGAEGKAENGVLD